MIDKTIAKEITIEAPAPSVWQVLTTPSHIKKYLFGTETTSDWTVGSAITFEGNFNGVTYKDKGTILAIEVNRLFQYDYLSSMSGLEDTPENYAVITFSLQEESGSTTVTVSQKGFSSEEAIGHSEGMWTMVLGQIKEIAESL